MKTLLLLLAAACALPAQDARLSFQKVFPGSVPAWVKITVERNGQGVYTEAADDPQPIQFRLPDADTAAMFALAEKLGYFSRTLESGLPVAKMGDKTLRYEAAGKSAEQKFNYTQDPDAQALTDWFEKISETERYLIDLEQAARFDKLGVNRVILLIQAAHEKKRLVATDQYLKWLDRIAKNESYLNMARERAARLADIFRNPAPPATEGAKQ